MEAVETWRAASEILLHGEPVATALWAVQSEGRIRVFINRPQAGGHMISETAAGHGIGSPVQTKAP